MRLTLLCTATLIAIASLGCNRLQPKKPTVAVRGVSVGAVSLHGVSGTLSVELTNPNSFGVPLAGVDWQLSIGDARAVSGRIALSNELPANGSTLVQIGLRVDALDAIAVARRLSAGERRYRVRGVLHFNAPIGRLDVAFHGEGDLGKGLASMR